jgi:hypothetical protein
MIPAMNIVAWGQSVPWAEQRQVEQDLIISRALVALFSDRSAISVVRAQTSVSALVKRFLTELASGEGDVERLKREEKELRARILAFRAGDRLSREDAHERGG